MDIKQYKFFFLLISLYAFTATAQNPQSPTDWANLGKYSTENKKLMPLTKHEKRIVFMGNSITESWQYADDFFSTNGYINRGISGQTTPQMLVRFRPDVIELQPSVVVIMAGINDIAENTGPIALEDVFGNIVSMTELAHAHHIKVVLSSVLPAIDFDWRPGLHPAEKIIKLNAMIQSYCATNHIVYLDYYSKMVDENKEMDKRFTADGVHPNLEGYKVMEPLVMEGIKRALKQKK